MGQWSDVNQLQSQIRKAENELKALVDKYAAVRADVEKKKAEVSGLYDRQDATVKEILGPRTMWEDCKDLPKI